MAQLDEGLRSLTTCSICMETYLDPRILSCVHTFCLRCLEKTAQNKRPGESMPCPICRKSFHIPNEGIKAVQKNFFMANLIEMMTIAKPNDIRPCGFCAQDFEGDGLSKDIPEAKVFCSECREFICDECSRHHRKQTPTRHHKVIPLGTGVVPTEVTSQNNCDKHSNEQIKLFCVNCSCAVCMLCFVESHKSHECNDIQNVAKDFRQKIGKNVATVSALLPKTTNRIEKLIKSQITVVKKLSDVEKQIKIRVEELQATIEVHKNKLLSDLEEIKKIILKQLLVQQLEAESHQTILESFKSYCSEIVSRASPIDVCKCSSDLDKRTVELHQIHQSQFEKPVSEYDASFKKFDLEMMLNYGQKNILGQIEGKMTSDGVDKKNVEFPNYWNLKMFTNVNTSESFFVPLQRDDRFNEVTALLTKVNSSPASDFRGQQWQGYDSDGYWTLPASKNLKIRNIWSIQNPELYRKYAAKKELMHTNSLVNQYGDLKQVIGSDVCTFKPEFKLLNGQLSLAHNERYLLYCATADMLKKISTNGFEIPKIMEKRFISAPGIHFVDSIEAEAQKQGSAYNNYNYSCTKQSSFRSRYTWTQRGADDTNYVCLSRVLLGDIFVCRQPRQFDRLPCRAQGCFSDRCKHGQQFGTFDSIVGLDARNAVCPDEMERPSRDFVILDSDQIYPEFLINYTQ